MEREEIGKRNYDSWFEEKICEKLNESSNSIAQKRSYSFATDNNDS